MTSTSALPDFYYFWFAAYEPFLTIIGFIGTWADPLATHNAQAPWPADIPPPSTLPRATLVTILQLAHVCALVGIINIFLLNVIRKHLHTNPSLQEKFVSALLTPLLIGDILHCIITLWALGDHKFDFPNWSPMIWTVHLLELSLIIPRVAWVLGIGRYVDTRDGPFMKSGPMPSHKSEAMNINNTSIKS